MGCNNCAEALAARDEFARRMDELAEHVKTVGTDAVVSVMEDLCRDHGIRIDTDDPRRGIVEAIRPAPQWGKMQGFAFSIGAPEWDRGTLRQAGLDGGGRVSVQVWECHATEEPLIGLAAMANLTADQAERLAYALISASRHARWER
jgi:hypothetical protein